MGPVSTKEVNSIHAGGKTAAGLLKSLAAAIILGVFFPSAASAAGNSWLIDAERFHVSVHGELSCQDCHSAIGERAQHPDPADVNRSPVDFFDVDQCTACHDDVLDDIADGIHAGGQAESWQRLEVCIQCHDPHYQSHESGGKSPPGGAAPSSGQKCSACHAPESKLPAFADDDQKCLECHLIFPDDDTRGMKDPSSLCWHCHSSDRRDSGRRLESHALIDLSEYAASTHPEVSCVVCHPQSLTFSHGDQRIGDCRRCHLPHGEAVAHDAHTGVACGACHLEDVVPARDRESGLVKWRKPPAADRISDIHQMKTPEGDASCRRCHHPENTVGAAAMVLPAKSVICMPCHAATLSAADPISVLSLVLFFFGVAVVGSVWFSAGRPTAGMMRKLFDSLISTLKTASSGRIASIAGSLIGDGLLQRRLLAVSKERWILHSLVFYPMLFRFTWGIAALCTSQWLPGREVTTVLVDKNHPLTAFLFDFSGMMVILGVVFMICRRLAGSGRKMAAGLPPVDWPAHALFGSIVIIGFLLEGMRMAMTGSPGGAGFAFIGDAVSRLLHGYRLTGIYGYVWYLHAALTGAFLVYLPFSRMFHMITAPVWLAIRAARDGRQGSRVDS